VNPRNPGPVYRVRSKSGDGDSRPNLSSSSHVLFWPVAPSRGQNSTSRRPFQRAPRATVPPSTRGRLTKGRRFLCADGFPRPFLFALLRLPVPPSPHRLRLGSTTAHPSLLPSTLHLPPYFSSRYRKPFPAPCVLNVGTRPIPQKTKPTATQNFALGPEVCDLESIVSRSLRRTGIWTARSHSRPRWSWSRCVHGSLRCHESVLEKLATSACCLTSSRRRNMIGYTV
jgi:hypothetical protein